ncbi:sodium:proton antiporter [Enterovirga rhinocerotis]|uniref:UIT6 family transporter n=1 Tax=Enterovirga rhinocerotis TaxID=1339210 RepID=A0A4R7BYY2_9HYPH|nr:sodium:proton antiporter [Enterovirga rhinocerotis]TDR90502.1 UIT6 family transporter [Enterovirga rhinocerotis]
MNRLPLLLVAACLTLLLPDPALAAGLDGRSFGLVWALPFAGILLSIALLPQLAGHVWEHRMAAIAGFWILAALVPLAIFHGAAAALDATLHVVLLEYLPFVLLLFALFTIAGGLVVTGNLHGSPGVNTGILAFGTVLASFIGTTGASMVLIRPLIRANDNRRHNVHVVVFFIFLVSNVGGALTPLGDPPLFLGFLRGVSFFWTTTHLVAQTAFVAAILLGLFYLIDRRLYAREDRAAPKLRDPTPDSRLGLRGGTNLLLLAVLVGVIILSGVWRPGIGFEIGSARLELQNLVRDGTMVLLGLASLALTPKSNRIQNEFSWGPIREVAIIFAAIFICLVPVAAALSAGRDGAFAPLLGLVTRADGTPIEAAYFWMTGALSSVLDNAPTYVVFFELAGGDAKTLMGPLAGTLAAISLGAVFMGANTYIGNAPNFMVYAIARQQGVRMPSFLGYMAWSGAILLPIFVLVTLVFFL